MAFVADTKVLSKSGWKLIGEISGQDQILVRNFLGDAQFSQPFAIRKKQHDGIVLAGGSDHYSFEVTPDHKIIYTNDKGKQFESNARDVPSGKRTLLHHRSRYYPQDDFFKQFVKTGSSIRGVEAVDWYKLVGYMLKKGLVDKKKDRLFLYVDKDNPEKDMNIICGVLDNIGLEWTFVKPKTIVVSQKSNIANKLAIALGSRSRRSMYIPSKMINNSTTEYATALIETFIRASRKDGQGVEKTLQFSTSNMKLIKSMEVLGLLSGYTISNRLVKPAGSKVPRGFTKRDSHVVYVRKSVNEVSITSKKEKQYSGSVYEIDIFEGQVITKIEGSLPVWMQPK